MLQQVDPPCGHQDDLGVRIRIEITHRGETTAGRQIRAAPDDPSLRVVDAPARDDLHGALQVDVRHDRDEAVLEIAAVVTRSLP